MAYYKFFDAIHEVGRNYVDKNEEIDHKVLTSFINEVWELPEYRITYNAYMFDIFLVNEINKLFSKYFRRQPIGDDNEAYEYFEKYPKINRASEILNESTLLSFLKQNEYFTDYRHMATSLSYMAYDFIYNFTCRDSSMHFGSDTDLEYILFNNSLAFGLTDSNDKIEIIEQVRESRKPTLELSENLKECENSAEELQKKEFEKKIEKDRRANVDELYNKIIGESTIVFKNRKKVIFQEMFGNYDQEFIQSGDWKDYFGQTDDEKLSLTDIFKDIDYLVGITEDENSISYHIYDVYYTVDKFHIFKYIKTETLEKRKVLIELEV